MKKKFVDPVISIVFFDNSIYTTGGTGGTGGTGSGNMYTASTLAKDMYSYSSGPQTVHANWDAMRDAMSILNYNE